MGIKQLKLEANIRHSWYCIDQAFEYATDDQKVTLVELKEQIEKAHTILFPDSPLPKEE